MVQDAARYTVVEGKEERDGGAGYIGNTNESQAKSFDDRIETVVCVYPMDNLLVSITFSKFCNMSRLWIPSCREIAVMH